MYEYTQTIIDGNLALDLIDDIKDVEGLQSAKDAWWETYLYIRQQEAKQYKEKGLI